LAAPSHLRCILSILPPNQEPASHQPLSVWKDKQVFLHLHLEYKSEYDPNFCALQYLAGTTMNHLGLLDLFNLEIPDNLLEDTNSVLRSMRGIQHVRVPEELVVFISYYDSYTCNENIQYIVLEPHYHDIISAKLLHGIKHNSGMVCLELKLWEDRQQENIHALCQQALDGNRWLSSLSVCFDKGGNKLSTELAMCKNGWNLKTINIDLHTTNCRDFPGDEIFDRLVVPLLALNWFSDYQKQSTSEISDLLMTPCIWACNQGVILNQVTNQPIVKQIPSKISVIYFILRSKGFGWLFKNGDPDEESSCGAWTTVVKRQRRAKGRHVKL
jgi:hypothetical protein